jgi:chemotaxis protein methyltransferase CheR
LQEGALDAGAQTLLARAYANCGRLEEALSAIIKAVQRDKLSVEARYIMGLVLLELGDIQQAQEALNSALYLEPSHILSHVNQGRIAMRLGKPVLARKHHQNAIELLQALPADCLVPESDGLTAAQFAAVLKTNVSQP